MTCSNLFKRLTVAVVLGKDGREGGEVAAKSRKHGA